QYVPLSQKGVPYGVAGLDENGELPNYAKKEDVVDYPFTKEKIDNLIPNISNVITNPLTVGLLLIDNTIDAARTNWRTSQNRPVKGGDILNYKGNPTVNTDPTFVTVLGITSANTLKVLIPSQSTSDAIDFSLVIPDDVVSVSATYRALTSDTYSLTLIRASSLVPEIKVENLPRTRAKVDEV